MENVLKVKRRFGIVYDDEIKSLGVLFNFQGSKVLE